MSVNKERSHFGSFRLIKNEILKPLEKANPGSKAAEPGSYNTGSVRTPGSVRFDNLSHRVHQGICWIHLLHSGCHLFRLAGFIKYRDRLGEELLIVRKAKKKGKCLYWPHGVLWVWRMKWSIP